MAASDGIRRLRLAPLLGPGWSAHFAQRALEPGHILDRHRHDFFELFWIDGGCGWHELAGVEHGLAPGDGWMIRPDDAHRFRAEGRRPLLISNLAFGAEVFDRLGAAGLGRGPGWFAEGVEALRLRFDAGQRRLLRQQADAFLAAGNGPVATTAFLATLRLLAVAAPTAPAPTVPEWVRMLRERLAEPEVLRAGVPALIDLGGRSAAHLAREWRRCFGRTPTASVTELRLQRARELLLQGDRRPLAIALEVGFNDLSHFYRQFRRRYGCAPQRYRRRQRGIFG